MIRKLDPNRCSVTVYGSSMWARGHQCHNKVKVTRTKVEYENIRGHRIPIETPRGYCGTHDPEVIKAKDKARREANEAKWAEESRRRKMGYMGPEYIKLLKKARKFLPTDLVEEIDLVLAK